MKITHWKHENVSLNGKVKNGGAVKTDVGIDFSTPDGNCGMDGCHCSDGHWMSICFGYNKKEKSVSGITINFGSRLELEETLDYNFIEETEEED